MSDSFLTDDFEALIQEKGTKISLEMSFRLLNHDTEHMLYIAEGDVDLFAIRPKGLAENFSKEVYLDLASHNKVFLGDFIEGNLIYLGKATDHNFVFPFSLEPFKNPYKVVLRANTNTTLYKVPLEVINASLKENPEFQNKLLNDLYQWIEQLVALFKHNIAEHYHHFLSPTPSLFLQMGNRVKIRRHGNENRLLFFQVLSGKLHFIGIPSLEMQAASPPIPLTPDLWLAAFEESEITLFSYESLSSQTLFWDSIKTFHRMILQFIIYDNLRIHNEQRAQFIHKQDQDREFLDLSLKKIGHVLSPEKHYEWGFTFNRLYSASQIVGSYIGESFSEPKYAVHFNLKNRIYLLSKDSHVKFRHVLLGANWWNAGSTPFLGCISKNKVSPIALIPTSRGNYELVDPDNPETPEVVTEKVAQEISAEATMYYHSFPQKVTKKALIQFFLAGQGNNWILLVFVGLLGTVFSLYIPFATQTLFDHVIPNSDTSLLWQVVMGLLIVSSSVALFLTTREYMVLRLMTIFDHDFSCATWSRILDLPSSFFRQYTSGDLIQRIFGVHSIRIFMSGQLIRSLLNVVFSIVYISAMSFYSPALTLIAVAFLTCIACVSLFCFWKSFHLEKKIQELQGHLNGKVVHIVQGISKVKTNGGENRVFASWGNDISKVKQIEYSQGLIENALFVTTSAIPYFAYILIFSTVIFLVQQEEMVISIGVYLAFIAAFMSLSVAFSEFLAALPIFSNVIPKWMRNRVILDAEPEVYKGKKRPGLLTGAIEIDDVSFRYGDDCPYILKNIKMQIKPGEFIGIVGATGSGKSSLLRLLIGFETPDRGTILYDGKDISTLDLVAIRSQIGTILQNSMIFDASLIENIRAGNLASEQEVMEAIRAANFEEDLDELPMGLQTYLMNNGGTLSGGQKQRLLIARALIGKPKILLFDEATSALDNKTQSSVINSLDKLDVTRVIVAHRLSTVSHADRIYVFDKGTIVETGTYQELMHKGGHFTEMLKKQNLL